jgi:RHS repeat-associated protein
LAQVNVTAKQIHYYFNGHLGTPILQTDATARIVWQVEYEPYGAVYAARRGEAKHQPLRFPGQELGGSGELSYNIHRWYRARWGRYTQDDPLLQAAVTEYGYAAQDPVGTIDPLGLYAIDKQVTLVPTPNIGAVCKGGLGSACTLDVSSAVSCKCSCNGTKWEPNPTLVIYGKLYYYTGNPKTLKTKPFDTSVVDPASSVAHEFKYHIDLGIAAVDPLMKNLENMTFDTSLDCKNTCISYSIFVNYVFNSYVSYTQYVENKKQKPQPPY